MSLSLSEAWVVARKLDEQANADLDRALGTALRELIPVAPRLQPCGTIAACQRHYAAGEKPCELCRSARAAYQRARRGVGSCSSVPTPTPAPASDQTGEGATT